MWDKALAYARRFAALRFGARFATFFFATFFAFFFAAMMLNRGTTIDKGLVNVDQHECTH
jgi:hypothetical protein